MADINDARLDRIETKLDKMAEALIVLVRIEERTKTLFKRLDASDARMNGISTRLTDLKKTSDRRRRNGGCLNCGDLAGRRYSTPTPRVP